MKRAILIVALLSSCASAQAEPCDPDGYDENEIIRHPNGVFEDTVTGQCFVFVGAGVWAGVHQAPCPNDPPKPRTP